MIRIQDLSLDPRLDGESALSEAVRRRLGVPFTELTVVRRSVDARKKSDVRLIYTVDVSLRDERGFLKRNRDERVFAPAETVYAPPVAAAVPKDRPVVAGFGPAGLFASLLLAEAGLRPIVLERGLDVDARTERVRRFREEGVLDPACNVQFGEGGAGTFSDGKLHTGTRDERIPWVLRRLVEAGAPDHILYDAKPHLGTDILRRVVKNIRLRILSLGGEVRFGTRLTGLVSSGNVLQAVRAERDGETYTLPCSSLLLAVGHSARDTFEMLLREGVALSPKAFAMGVRVEHRQRDIDLAQYGSFAGLRSLGAADYKLTCHTASSGVYTFCMCPGGYVMAAASEEGGVVTNGMSYSGRAGKNANSALLVGLPADAFPHPGPLGGVRWQRELEQRAFRMGGGNYYAPMETVGDFLGVGHGDGSVTPTYAPGVRECDLHALLPDAVSAALTEALPRLGKRLRGFDAPGAVLTGPETRSSSPVRILRGADRQSVTLGGLYPCGEGAGYAGGITSAAVDGLLSAEAFIAALNE